MWRRGGPAPRVGIGGGEGRNLAAVNFREHASLAVIAIFWETQRYLRVPT